MSHSRGTGVLRSIGGWALFVGILSIPLSWMTYQTAASVFGVLSFLLIGVVCFLVWSLPFFVGIILMLLSLGGVLPLHAYRFALNLSGVGSSWITLGWFGLSAALGVLFNLLLTFELWATIRFRRFRFRPPGDDIALVNCRIIDGNSDSAVIEDGVILIKNRTTDGEMRGRITAVGPRREVSIPADFKRIDLQGKFVLPGLINSHCHMLGDGRPTKIAAYREETVNKILSLFNYKYIQRLMYRRMVRNVNSALNAGVTTIRTMGDLAYLDLKIRDQVRTGKLLGPRILVSGKVIAPTGGHGGAGGLFSIAADGADQLKTAVRTNIRREVDCIKICSTGGVLDARMVGEAGRPEMTVAEIETACIEAHRGRVMVAAHCESTEGIREALAGGVDTIEHGADIPEELVGQFKNNPKTLRGYTCIVPTLGAGMGMATLPIEDTKLTPVKFENARIVETQMILGLQKAYRHGIKFATGNDATAPYATHYDVWKELKYYLKYTDMTAKEAIYFATKNTAEVLGIDAVTGSIEVGKSADLLVVERNPLDDIDALGRVEKVVIGGHVIHEPAVKKLKLKDVTPIEMS